MASNPYSFWNLIYRRQKMNILLLRYIYSIEFEIWYQNIHAIFLTYHFDFDLSSKVLEVLLWIHSQQISFIDLIYYALESQLDSFKSHSLFKYFSQTHLGKFCMTVTSWHSISFMISFKIWKRIHLFYIIRRDISVFSNKFPLEIRWIICICTQCSYFKLTVELFPEIS